MSRSRASIVSTLLSLALVATSLPGIPDPAAAGTVVVGAAADGWVSSADPTRNNGSHSRLKVRTVSTKRFESHLRFTVAGAGSVSDARLRLFVADGSPNGGSVFLSSTDWTESALTWNTRPALIGSQVAAIGTVGPKTWVEVDVSSAVAGDGTYSFALTGGVSDAAGYHSRESSAAKRPQLVLTTEDGGGDPDPPPQGVVSATAETDPVPHGMDAADDAAIWTHPTDPSQSTIIGTDKQPGGGLGVYDLSGNEIAFVADAAMNNVDIRDDFPLGGTTVNLVAASDRDNQAIAVYRVDPSTRGLVSVAAGVIDHGSSLAGLCMYHSPVDGRFYAFITDVNPGILEQWELSDDGSGQVTGTMVRTFDVGGASEGCVADDERGHLYIGEEAVGIWRYGAEPTASTTRQLIDSTGTSGNLSEDVEGLAIAYSGTGGHLIASSQGNDSFVIYDRDTYAHVGTFQIAGADGIDGVSHTDGIDVEPMALGPDFPGGVFVAQDGSNGSANQNFKLVRWDEVLAGL